jgi:uncharacterized caspase-like protein
LICSPIFTAITTVVAGVYVIRNPTLASVIITSAGVKCLEIIQYQLRQYDLNRYKAAETVEDDDEEEEEEEEEEVEEVEEVEEKEKVEETYDSDDEGEDEEYLPSHPVITTRRTYNLRNR